MNTLLLEQYTEILEARGLIKNVIRGGVMKQKLMCPEGFMAKKGQCVKMTSSEIMKRQKAAKLAIRTRARNAGKNRISSAKSKLMSDKARIRFKTQLSKVRPGG
jgi:hypothetical protein